MKKSLQLILLLFTVIVSVTIKADTSDKKILTIAYASNWPPYSYIDADGNASGILVEIADTLFKQHLGIPIQHSLLPWKRAQAMVEAGSADMLLAVPNDNRLSYSDANRSEIYAMQVRAFLSRNSPTYNFLMSQDNPLEHEHDFRYLLLLGDDTCQGIYEKNTVKYHTSSNLDQILKMLTSHRGELFLHSRVAAMRSIIQQGLEEQIVMHPKVFRNVSLFFMISEHYQDRKQLIKAVDKAVMTLKQNNSYESLISRIEQEQITRSLALEKQ